MLLESSGFIRVIALILSWLEGHGMSISGRLFERGLAYVGTDYLSYPLWDEYIRYEESQQAWSNLALIYTRILENPVQQLDRYFNCFKDLAASRALSEIRTPEEAALVAASLEIDVQGVHGEACPDGVEQSSKLLLEGHTSMSGLLMTQSLIIGTTI